MGEEGSSCSFHSRMKAGQAMEFRGWAAAAACVLASCTGCVTESKSVPVSEKEYAKLNNVKPSNTSPHELKPETLVQLGRVKEGFADDPKIPQLQQSVCRDEARKKYNQAIQQDPKWLDAYLALAGTYVKMEDLDHANEVYQRGLSQLPRAPQLWYEQSNVYLRRKDFPAALQCLAKAHELEPSSHLYCTQYGLCLARMGKPEEAVQVMTTVMSKAEAAYNVARMMEHIKQTDSARHYLQVALQDRPTHEDALRMMIQLDQQRANGVGQPLVEGGSESGVRQATFWGQQP
jgi:tetratricopeptide (TPR) repeat protein